MLNSPSANPLLVPSMLRIAVDVEELFDEVLKPSAAANDRLGEAMRYAAMGGGKRLRPLLVVASGALFGVAERLCLRAGLAVEALHAHSLIHDDLPCMDDDDVRRGKPTVHRAFDEATAVLAGDALLALAFELLSSPETHPDSAIRAELTCELARAAGMAGMAGGQLLDLAAEGRDMDFAEIVRLQRLKTGALIGWCVDAGATMGYASPALRVALRGYAACLGLAYQIRDDILDATGDPCRLGKPARKDARRGKGTFVSVLGVDGARERAELLVGQAIAHLKDFGEDAALLREIAQFAIERDR